MVGSFGLAVHPLAALRYAEKRRTAGPPVYRAHRRRIRGGLTMYSLIAACAKSRDGSRCGRAGLATHTLALVRYAPKRGPIPLIYRADRRRPVIRGGLTMYSLIAARAKARDGSRCGRAGLAMHALAVSRCSKDSDSIAACRSIVVSRNSRLIV